jgi:hypothetical protein
MAAFLATTITPAHGQMYGRGLGRDPVYGGSQGRGMPGYPNSRRNIGSFDSGFGNKFTPFSIRKPRVGPPSVEYQQRMYVGREVARTPLARFHEEVFGQKSRKPRFSGSFRTWVQPNVYVRRKKIESSKDKSAASVDSGEKVDLNELTETYIVSRRDEYFQRGWQFFERELYEDAYNSFDLADRVSFKEPEIRARAKLAQFYTAVASEQHSLAITHLRWLLQERRQTGQLPDPLFLLSVENLDQKYGDLKTFNQHIQRLVTVASQDRVPGQENQAGARETIQRQRLRFLHGVAPIRAMAAVMLWAKNKDEAVFFAQNMLTEEGIPQPWSKLPDLIELSAEEARRRASESQNNNQQQVAGNTSAEVMPWEVEETEGISSQP